MTWEESEIVRVGRNLGWSADDLKTLIAALHKLHLAAVEPQVSYGVHVYVQDGERCQACGEPQSDPIHIAESPGG